MNFLKRIFAFLFGERKATTSIMTHDEKVNLIMNHTKGELTKRDTLKLFAELIRTGEVGQWQGDIGRTAYDFIEDGLITEEGIITKEGELSAKEN